MARAVMVRASQSSYGGGNTEEGVADLMFVVHHIFVATSIATTATAAATTTSSLSASRSTARTR